MPGQRALTPVQPFSLCEAVTIATEDASSSNSAKYAIGDTDGYILTSMPAAISPLASAVLTDRQALLNHARSRAVRSAAPPDQRPRPMPSACTPMRLSCGFASDPDAETPARVMLPKAARLDERLGLEESVRLRSAVTGTASRLHSEPVSAHAVQTRSESQSSRPARTTSCLCTIGHAQRAAP